MLPDRVQACAQRWGLTLGEPLAGGTSSLVFGAQDGSGHALVLKLPAGRADPADAVAAEAAALRVWSTTGVTPRLIAFDHECLLLERIVPGVPMASLAVPSDLPESDPPESVAELADLLKRLWAADPAATDPAATDPPGWQFQNQADFYRDAVRVALDDVGWERRRRGEPERGEAGLRCWDLAHRSAEALMDDAELFLLHGDFIAKNVISETVVPGDAGDARVPSTTGWRAIDPLPYLGDRASEVAAFAAYQPAASILPTAEALAAACGLDPRRVLRWSAVWSVHQVVQAWRDDQAELEQLVTSREVRRRLEA